MHKETDTYMQVIEEVADKKVQTTKETTIRIAKYGVQEERKPKRKVAKPTYLNDYV